MKNRSIYYVCRRGILTVFFLSFSVCWLTACSLFTSKPTHKTDEILLNDFQKNKADLAKLVQMLKENSNLKDSKVSEQDLKENKVSDEKVKEYESLWRKLFRYRSSVNFYSDNSVCFLASEYNQSNYTGDGDANFYSSKGFCWLDNPSKNQTVENLDNFDEKTYKNLKTDEKSRAFRNVEGNWHLYYSAERSFTIRGE